MTDDYVSQIVNGTNALNKVVFQVLAEQAQQAIKESPKYVYYSWNLTAYEQQLIYESLIDKFPILITVYNPKSAGRYVIKVKVPNVNFDVLD